MEFNFLELFGVSFETLAQIAGIAFFVVELAKKRFPKLMANPWGPRIVNLLICFLISLKLYGFANYEPLIATTVLSFLGPEGFNAYLKNKKG